ncbi:tetratricopeptide repeat protein [Fulvivirgaceae bacterium BMA10]|uniref:Tetratricopeptide repeat protein n=1 Tax=Splendidivirga corallicola TaxID=3051826 RepID=A0ABT8KJ34_9BACT|nr:tetratricopeptide repeat protein [Fulvivirgaceae bacterium BMA10]
MEQHINAQDLELIEKYLSQEATAQEISVIEKRLKEDKAFAERLSIFQTLKQGNEMDIEGFRSDLDDIYRDYDQQPQEEAKVIQLNTHRKRSFYWIAAAVSILLLSTVYLIINQASVSSPQDLYAAHYTTPPENISTRDEQDDHLVAAIQAYNVNDFKKALEEFEIFLSTNQNHIGAIFYQGICELELGKTDDAIEHFNTIINEGDSVYLNSAKWYLALSYLKADRKQEAIKTLEDIKDSGSSYAAKAILILEELD